jgi:hypothetical protein
MMRFISAVILVLLPAIAAHAGEKRERCVRVVGYFIR